MKGMVIQDMKKMFHRIGALAVAFMMALSLAAPAMAATTNDSEPRTNIVQVESAVPKATYTLYKLLQLEGKFETEGEGAGATEKVVAYRYSYDSALKDIISKVVDLPQFKYMTEAEKTELEKTDPGAASKVIHPGYGFQVKGENVTFITPATSDKGEYTEDETVKKMMTAFADELRQRIDKKGASLAPFDLPAEYAPEDTEKKTNLNPNPVEATTNTVTFKQVPNGYWMVTSNAGARSIIFTSPEKTDTSQTVTVTEKNTAPTIEKKVFDADDVGGTVTEKGGSWKDANDAQIGDPVKFKITVWLHQGAENIVVYDEMSDGLTFKALEGVNFFPRNKEKDKDGTDKFDRVVYKLNKDGTLNTANTTDPAKGLALTETDDTGNVVLKTDVAKLVSDEHGFRLIFQNAFTNPAAGAANRSESDSMNNAFLGDLSTLEDDGGRIEIEYTAILNENAVIKGDRKLICKEAEGAGHTHGDACYTDSNDNESYVKYGHIPSLEPGETPDDPTPPGETPKDTTKTYTYKFKIDKYVDGDPTTKLDGAEFELRQIFAGIGQAAVADKGNAYVKVEKVENVDVEKLMIPDALYKKVENEGVIKLVDITPTTDGYKDGKVYRVATPEEIKDNSAEVNGEAKALTEKIVTDTSGQITIQGLDSNLYAIKEIKAPAGYNMLTKSVMMAIGSVFSEKDGTVFTEEDVKRADNDTSDHSFNKLDPANPITVPIANASGIQMPNTGGIGTTIFYAVGGILVLGAGVLLILKKRAGRTED